MTLTRSISSEPGFLEAQIDRFKRPEARLRNIQSQDSDKLRDSTTDKLSAYAQTSLSVQSESRVGAPPHFCLRTDLTISITVSIT